MDIKCSSGFKTKQQSDISCKHATCKQVDLAGKISNAKHRQYTAANEWGKYFFKLGPKQNLSSDRAQ